MRWTRAAVTFLVVASLVGACSDDPADAPIEESTVTTIIPSTTSPVVELSDDESLP